MYRQVGRGRGWPTNRTVDFNGSNWWNFDRRLTERVYTPACTRLSTQKISFLESPWGYCFYIHIYLLKNWKKFIIRLNGTKIWNLIFDIGSKVRKISKSWINTWKIYSSSNLLICLNIRYAEKRKFRLFIVDCKIYNIRYRKKNSFNW